MQKHNQPNWYKVEFYTTDKKAAVNVLDKASVNGKLIARNIEVFEILSWKPLNSPKHSNDSVIMAVVKSE